MRTRAVAAVIAVVLCGFASTARANGRFPAANHLVLGGASASDLVVRTTFGLLPSHDRGVHLGWVCERLIGFTDQIDPAITVFGDGSLTAAYGAAMAITHDDDCTFAPASGAIGAVSVVDGAIDPASPLRGAFVSTRRDESNAIAVDVFRTEDAARTFTQVGTVPAAGFLVSTLDLAKSDASRLYVSGSRLDGGNRVGVFGRSDDGGATFTMTDVDLAGGTSLYIGAIDPTNADVIYARSDGDAQSLFVSSDAGQTFTSTPFFGQLLGLAVSPDGTHLAVGGPTAGLAVIDVSDHPAPIAIAPTAVVHPTCLAWGDDGLFACGTDFADGFFLGRSDDQGASFVTLVASMSDITGPLTTCAAASAYAATCPADWSPIAETIGASIGESGGAATVPSGGAPASPPSAPPPSSSGGCSVADAPTAAILPLIVIAALRRRRR